MSRSYSPIPELNLLKEFQDRVGFECYAEGFGLIGFGDTSGLVHGWSADPGFLTRLVPFAQANGSGSLYALWRTEEGTALAAAPVVVFGDEGGVHVVARNLRELFALLALDTEITVEWEEAFFSADEDEERERSRGHGHYVTWLHETLGVHSARDSSAVARAQDELGPAFADWVAGYLD